MEHAKNIEGEISRSCRRNEPKTRRYAALKLFLLSIILMFISQACGVSGLQNRLYTLTSISGGVLMVLALIKGAHSLDQRYKMREERSEIVGKI